MSEDNRPVVPTDMATEALIKHWRARTNRHAHAANVTASGAIVLAPLTGTGTGTVTAPPSASDPRDLLPTLVMQTLIIPESKNADGMLIQAVTIAWREILKLIEHDPNLIGSSCVSGGYSKMHEGRV